jgi:regulator of protease activity HflC (stomatin/prohibitin superfamily)
MRVIITVGFCFLLFVFITSGIHIIEPGTVGIKVTFGNVSDAVVKDGFNIVNPFSKVVRFSTLTQNYIMSSIHDEGAKAGDDSITVLSSNGLSINMDISVPHKLCPEQAPWVLKNWGKDYEEKFVRQTIASSLSEVSSRYTDSEIYATKRLKFVEDVHKQIELDIRNLCKQKDGSFVDSPVIISQVLLKNVRLPAIVKAAIEKKLRVDQEAQEMDFTITKTTGAK